MNNLRIGDKVLWRGSWGKDPEKEAIVDSIEVNCKDKYGDPVIECPWNKIKDRSVVIILKNGHWAYGFQIKPLENKEKTNDE